MRFAAIDIGSNALRLLTMNVFANNGNPIFKKESLIRIPLRLGEEAFMDGVISDAKVKKLSGVMQAFKNLMDANDVLQYRACATAAMREASNGPEIIEKYLPKPACKLKLWMVAARRSLYTAIRLRKPWKPTNTTCILMLAAAAPR